MTDPDTRALALSEAELDPREATLCKHAIITGTHQGTLLSDLLLRKRADRRTRRQTSQLDDAVCLSRGV